MAKRTMNEGLKAKKSQAAATARIISEQAPQLLEEYGAMLLSWRFWKTIPSTDRDAILAAIRKAEVSLLNKDIKTMQAELQAKIEAKENLAKR
jgi:TRAP-type C4-dicarboxylate transport system substrate-binding protein